MIKKLHIYNYALFKNVEIDFTDGFTVISGDTGAGKSIMLDALSLVLGKRVDRFAESSATQKSIIEAEFLLNDSHKKFFNDNDIDFDQETIIRREISINGKSRAFINDTPVLLNVLTQFSHQIVEIFSQHEKLVFKDPKAQFIFLDEVADSNEILLKYRLILKEYNDIKSDINNIKKKGSLSLAELEFLQFQFNELNDAKIKNNEKEIIEEKIKLLENVDSISLALDEMRVLFNNENGAISNINRAKKISQNLDSLSEISNRLESVIIELEDINSDISYLQNSLEADPNELKRMTDRLDLINSLLHKHRLKFVDQLFDLKEDLYNKIEQSESFEVLLNKKEKDLKTKYNQLIKLANILDNNRKKVIPKITNHIEDILKNLGIPHAQFQINLVQTNELHSFGCSYISMQFCANKGGEMKELMRVASGGELSRLMLAIKFLSAQNSSISTLIFDEIDSGVSGEIASLMGNMMQNISKSNQVIVISHLPQIASKAKTHLKVSKQIVDDKTTSIVHKLTSEDRVEEIAKLLSGKNITDAAIKNALDLLNQ
ncbi:MAG: DNA repair protein RecN [Flavobacteriales bacterium]|nr:DNA repair protein RecN [Flavobacteriales bacterium]